MDGFGKKTRELDDKRQGPEEIKFWRERYASLANHALEKAGIDARVDHRSYLARGIDKFPQPKLGPALTQIFRRDRTKIESSVVIERWEEAAEIRQLQFNLASIEEEHSQAPEDEAALAVVAEKKARLVNNDAVTNEKLIVEAKMRFPDNQAKQFEFICSAKIAIYAREAAQPGISEERKAYLSEQKVVLLENLKKLQAVQLTKSSHGKDTSECPNTRKREDKER